MVPPQVSSITSAIHTNCPWISIYFPLFILAVSLISLSTELATKPLSDLLLSLDHTLDPVSTSLLSFSQLRDALLDMGPLDLGHIKKVIGVFPYGYFEIAALHFKTASSYFFLFSIFFLILSYTNLFNDFSLEIRLDSLRSSTLIINAVGFNFRSFTQLTSLHL